MTIEELMKRYEEERAKMGISDSFSDPLNVVPPEAKADTGKPHPSYAKLAQVGIRRPEV